MTRVGEGEARVLPCASAPLFGAEIDAVADARDRGEASAISLQDSVATARALDTWRARINQERSASWPA